MYALTGGGDGARRPARWLRWTACSGLIAEGMVYLLIGGFALVAAFEPGQRPQGTQGALTKLADAPWGHAMLIVLALGLAAFVLWQWVLALFDPEHRRDRWHFKRIAVRLGYLLNAALHGVLVGYALWHLFGVVGDPGGHGRTQAMWAGRAMHLPLGRWAVAVVGTGICGFGIFQFYRAAAPNKKERIERRRTKLRGIVLSLGVLGFIARGVVFGLIGVLLIYTAWRYNVASATGIAGALGAVKQQAYGTWLLGAVAAGLIAYGLFEIADAGYRGKGAS